jgi:epoxyqueuosine reductase
MALNDAAGLFCAKLEERGYRGAVVPIEHVVQLKHEMEELLSQGAIDTGLCERYLPYFKFDVTAHLPQACSVIVTAAPQPQRRVTFHLNGQRHSFILPPTYYYDTDELVKRTLQENVGPDDYQLYATALPAKLLAVRSGIAEYGRNNIAYVRGMGSFVRLRAFLSDMPPGKSDWLERRTMKECDTCRACLNECPTGAIVPDRFLIHAERCITFLNEGPEEFPQWVQPTWHNSLIGCMKCQLICPANRGLVEWVEEGEDFNEAETELILSGTPLDRIPPATVQKLRATYMLDCLDVLPRNLGVLLRGHWQQRSL